ncbi:MAG TPA: ATP-binding cassette domain-containing protein [Microvirga sp.]|jgi:putative thiamine transport system ATP-binding protein|nr:ATP-binding cassette domain-containing protein [Microvirga sp.]
MSLELRSVAIALGSRILVPALSFVVGPGEIATVMGPSGSGKSTLLAFIGGFLDRAFTASGEVLVGGEPITRLAPEKRRVGILFQDDLLFPHLSIAENLAFGLAPRRGGRAARRRAVAEALAEAGLTGFEHRDPATLSGGQRARAALLRTLLAEPRALLLDEPFGKLDRALRHEIRAFVFEHARSRGLPMLLVTHDAEDAEEAGGRVISLAT